MSSKLPLAPSKSENKQHPQIPDIEMETSLLPEARFLLDSKAYCSGNPKIPGGPASLLCTVFFLCDWKNVLRLWLLECLIKIILPKSSRNIRQVTCRRHKHQRCILMSSHKKSQCRLELPGAQTHHVSALQFICFSPSHDTFRKNCSG